MSSFIRLIATTPELQTYAVQKLYANLKKDITQESLTQAGAWCIGEYGDALLKGGQYEEEELVQEVKESEVIDIFQTVLNSNYATQVTTEYIVTALTKLTTRLTDGTQLGRIQSILVQHQTSLDVEVQQRAVEYGNLFNYDQVRRGVMEKMPPPQIKEENRVLGEASAKQKKKANRRSKPIKQTEQDLLMDLMGDSVPTAPPTTGGSQNNADLLADILGGTTSPAPPSNTGTPAPQSNMSSIMDLFGPSPAQATPPPGAAAAPPPSSGMDLLGQMGGSATPAPQATAGFPCYNNNGLVVTIATQRNAEGIVQALARFRNASGGPLSSVGLQAAVPKSQRLQLNSISSTELAPGTEATQAMRVQGAKGVSYAVLPKHDILY